MSLHTLQNQSIVVQTITLKDSHFIRTVQTLTRVDQGQSGRPPAENSVPSTSGSYLISQCFVQQFHWYFIYYQRTCLNAPYFQGTIYYINELLRYNYLPKSISSLQLTSTSIWHLLRCFKCVVILVKTNELIQVGFAIIILYSYPFTFM